VSLKRCRPRDDGPTPLQWLLIELAAMPGCEATKARMIELLRRMVGQRLRLTRRDLVQPEREQVARAMLAGGMSATEARRRLAALYGVSRDIAERLVTAALQSGAR
jgi:hypothetical protein